MAESSANLALFRAACEPLFSASAVPGVQRAAAHRLFDLLSGFIGFDDATASDFLVNDTLLPAGKAISLRGAARCLWEYARSSKFLRGVEAALRAAQQRFPGERLRLLEAGCGPFALLALPLALRFRPDEVGFTLLDIHDHSLDAARRIVAALGLEAYIDAYVAADATVWRCPESQRPHVIVSETMQSGLKSEPQVAVTRNLARQRMPGGYFVPEAVTLDFALLTWHAGDGGVGRQVSHPVARLFELTPDAEDAVVHGEIKLPAAVPANARSAICTGIRVFGDIALGENECSLTLPLRIKELPVPAAGEVLRYEFLLGPRPGLRFAAAR